MLEEELKKIVKKFALSDTDRQKYAKDAEEIRDYIIKKMKDENSDFKRYFNGALLTGSYLDGLKISKPDEFDYQIKLKLPITLTPERLPQNSGCVRLQVNGEHNFAENGYIQRHRVQTWMRDILKKVFMSELSMRATGGPYKLKYVSQGYGIAHTFEAQHEQNYGRRISFDFAPVFEFPASMWCFSKSLQNYNETWFVVPVKKRKEYNQEAFKVCGTYWERKIISNKMNLKNSLRLMKALRDTTGMTQLPSYMLKSTFLIETELQDDLFWRKPMGVIIVHMLDKVVQYLRQGNLPFYWDRTHNLIRYMDNCVCQKYAGELVEAKTILQTPDCTKRQLMRYFGPY